MGKIKWQDLYIKDFGDSQIKDKKELIIMQVIWKVFLTKTNRL